MLVRIRNDIMTQLATREKSIPQATSLFQRRAVFKSVRALPLILLGALVVLAYLATPILLHAYNLHQARRALELGMHWPLQRQVDSLPLSKDEQALDRALGHLAAAIRWQPHDAQAYRLAGQVYAARSDWSAAAHELELARTRAPKNPLVAWESMLMYEQLAHVSENTPREEILTDLASMPIDAPDQPIDTVYCRNGQAATCYVDLDQYTQAYAAAPDGPETTANVLFMHPPAAVKLTRSIPVESAALTFLMGLDPGVRGWTTDGVTFEIWLATEQQPAALVYQHSIDGVTARRGWVPGWLDLSAWSGQTVTLELKTTGGPAGNTVDDWFAWGNVAFTSPTAAEHPAVMARLRGMQALHSADITADQLVARGDQALAAGSFNDAITWYRRAQAVNSDAVSAGFQRGIASALAQQESLDQIGIVSLNKKVRLEAEQLRWLQTEPLTNLSLGDTLLTVNPNRPDVGIMNWVGRSAAVLEVADGGNYRIKLRAQHTDPAPIQIQLEHDLVPIGQFTLNREDQSWEELEVDVTLQPGIHLLGVRFLNDAIVDTIDRNAVLDWLEITRQ